MKRYFVCFYFGGSFGNSMVDVPMTIQTHEHILAMQKMIADKLKVEAKDLCIVNYILVQPT